jgi:hypothetical protein
LLNFNKEETSVSASDKSSHSCVMGKLHRVRIIRRKTGNIPGERYAWIKFSIYDKEKQEAGEFVYGNLRV